MSFLLSCPEVNSAQMYTGAGSAPMLAAAAAWDGLSAELDSAAESFKSLISGLTASWWQGQAAGKMIEVALPYAQWLGGAATQAGGAATGAKAVAALFEEARAAVVQPLAVELNRNQVVSLAIHNIFGLNAPAIAAKEIEYEEMWAAYVDAMLSYHGGASIVAQQLAPWQSALKGLTGQIAPAIGAPLPPAPAATLIEYSLLTALISITAATAIPGVSQFGLTMGAVITPVAKAATTAATTVVASTNAAVAPVAKAIASTPLVAAANAALAPAVSQVSLAVSGVALNAGQVANAVAQEAGKTIGLVQSAALTAQLTGLAGDPALLSGFVSEAIDNPALLNSFVPVLASNPALVTGIFGVLASNPQLVLSLVTQVQNNPALAAQLFGAFAQLQAANPALAAQLVDLATQLGRQLGIGQAA